MGGVERERERDRERETDRDRQRQTETVVYCRWKLETKHLPSMILFSKATPSVSNRGSER